MAFAPVQLPSGRWQGGFRTPAGRKVTKTFDYAWEAETWAAAAEVEARDLGRPAAPAAPADTAPTGPTVSAHGAAWLGRKGRLAKETRNGYATHLRAIDASHLGARIMSTVRPSEVEQWQSDQLTAGVGAPTINARVKVLRMVYRDAVREGLTPADATAGVALLPLAIRQDACLAGDAVDRMLAAAWTPQLRALVLLGADAGLRYQEAAGLPASAVVGDYLIIRQVLEKSTGTIRPWPKGKRERVVPMTTRLRAALAPLVAAAEGPDALLVTTENGAPLLYDNFRHRVWPRLKRVSGVRLPKGQGIHQLRHHAGSALADAGVPRHEIAEFLGHADESTTKRYIHSGDDGRRLALVRAALEPADIPTPLRVVSA